MSALEAERSWAEIELAALRHNAAVARARAGAGVALLAVVKANAYGHGLTATVRALAEQAQLFGVANLQEALAVRAVVPHPVIILGTALPAERSGIVQAGFIPSVSSYEEASEFGRYAAGSQKVAITCAIDTGMGRMGVAENDAAAAVRRITALPGIELHSISTHPPVADEDPEFTRQQLERFSALVAQLRGEFPIAFQVHALPSAGVISFPGAAHEIVRAGLMLYGISPIAEFQQALRPALTWKTRVILVRELGARQLGQLWPNFYRRSSDARGDAECRLRGRAAAFAFQSRRHGADRRPALSDPRPRHDGPDGG